MVTEITTLSAWDGPLLVTVGRIVALPPAWGGLGAIDCVSTRLAVEEIGTLAVSSSLPGAESDRLELARACAVRLPDAPAARRTEARTLNRTPCPAFPALQTMEAPPEQEMAGFVAVIGGVDALVEAHDRPGSRGDVGRAAADELEGEVDRPAGGNRAAAEVERADHHVGGVLLRGDGRDRDDERGQQQPHGCSGSCSSSPHALPLACSAKSTSPETTVAGRVCRGHPPPPSARSNGTDAPEADQRGVRRARRGGRAPTRRSPTPPRRGASPGRR